MANCSDQPIADLVGIGFGPSNLALAIACEEMRPADRLEPTPEVAFFEKQTAFGWHRGMLMEDATMQVSFLKDLATMRDPQSRYTFTAYLHAKNRMTEFINSKTLFPLRVEFHDYLEWAARPFAAQVSYNHDVTAIDPVLEDGVVTAFDVTARSPVTGAAVVRRTRNVVLGTGLAPYLPPEVPVSERIWHSSELIRRTRGITPPSPGRVVVVGAGQSAAEATEYLHRTFLDAEICTVFSRYGYSVADDSPFTNSIFDPQAVDEFFVAPREVKQLLLARHSNTNYSVVDLALTQELYRRSYQEKVVGRERLRTLHTSRVTGIREQGGKVQLDIEGLSTGSVRTIDADAVVYATGYQPTDPLPLLGSLASECKLDDSGRLLLERDYRVITSDAVQGGIYLHGGGAEHTHGLSAGLLSNTAVRSGEIAHSILRR
ncbi:lysine N(6)-hydroxylase/L-ornithine N(5)-oxygenase family protein [Actinacidiphila soli]|uniref:lysine N(6)-hydroxylase/L-ornithine N(5)-oxygenase family protein n=1 Tax=Actinacidiphila soli TaxID=2487275 RepID=UPI000FCC7E73|nr:SidA/IucD/PvdA family monooxygenase [Actinacidiphila soli]